MVILFGETQPNISAAWNQVFLFNTFALIFSSIASIEAVNVQDLPSTIEGDLSTYEDNKAVD
ncbi:hypothetical protein BKA61DRAFT_520369 [Leptodontidium sp. MPI-SDFR-AT-0119]|nr:hypothetical protein BKA61DRAFT_520369 [Leptodontidium sp. MPI-SDFR-AT-0119]